MESRRALVEYDVGLTERIEHLLIRHSFKQSEFDRNPSTSQLINRVKEVTGALQSSVVRRMRNNEWFATLWIGILRTILGSVILFEWNWPIGEVRPGPWHI